jgi:predicted nucleic acid-binding protein
VRFWDTSAVVPLCTAEQHSERLHSMLERDPHMVVWWGTRVECTSAFARRRREGAFSPSDERAALRVLEVLGSSWRIVTPTEAVRDRAMRLVRVHPLRAADAFQLAAALAWVDDSPRDQVLVTLDRRLAEAARLEGFSLP